jgi:hypothetical protein
VYHWIDIFKEGKTSVLIQNVQDAYPKEEEEEKRKYIRNAPQ